MSRPAYAASGGVGSANSTVGRRRRMRCPRRRKRWRGSHSNSIHGPGTSVDSRRLVSDQSSSEEDRASRPSCRFPGKGHPPPWRPGRNGSSGRAVGDHRLITKRRIEACRQPRSAPWSGRWQAAGVTMTSLDRPVRVVRVRTIATGVFLGMWAFFISATLVSLLILRALTLALGRSLGDSGL